MALRPIHSAPIENHPGPRQSIRRLPPRRQKRVLDKEKCEACRNSKQKCLPKERRWPEQRCERCVQKHLPCSAPAKKERVASRRPALSYDPDSSLPPSIQVAEYATPVMEVPVHDNAASSSAFIDSGLIETHGESGQHHPSAQRNSTSTHSNLAQGVHLEPPQGKHTSPLPNAQPSPWMDEATLYIQNMVDEVEDGEDWDDTEDGEGWDHRCEDAYNWVRHHPQSANILKYFQSMDHYASKALLEGVFGLAIDKGDVSIVEQLLAASHDLKNIGDRWGVPRTALQRACDRPNFKIVDSLLRAGADPNGVPVPSHNEEDEGKLKFLPPLSYHLFECWLLSDECDLLPVARILLENGAHINGGRIIPLSLAAENHNVEMVKFLLANGADARLSSPKDGRTPLSSALLRPKSLPGRNTITEIVEALVRAGADVEGCFPAMVHEYHCYLDMAVKWKTPELVELLLTHGAHPCHVALQRALRLRCAGVPELLVGGGAEVNGDVIRVAAEHSSAELVIFLIDRHDDHTVRRQYDQIAFTNSLLHGRNDLAAQLASRDAHLSEGDQLTTAIERAAGRDDKQMISLLFDQQSPYRQTAIECMGESLSVAILEGSGAVAEILLAASLGSDSSASRPNARSLWAALIRGKTSLARRLLSAGTPVTIVQRTLMGGTWKTKVQSVLPGVAHVKDTSLALEIIAAGADINAPGFDDNNPEPALVTAIRYGRKDLFRVLIDAGADVNPKGLVAEVTVRTPLQAAVERGNVEFVHHLLSLGADPEDEGALCVAVRRSTPASAGLFDTLVDAVRTRRSLPWKLLGRCVLQEAVLRGDFTIISTILTCKVDLDSVVHSYSGQSDYLPIWIQESCFGTAIRVDRRPGYPVVHTLLRAGANPNAITIADTHPQPSLTALMQAIEQSDIGLVILLINSGAEVNMNNPIPTLLPRSPLQLAVEVGHYEIVKLLLFNSAKVNEAAAEYHGATALQIAARGGDINITKLLLDHGADINAPPATVGGKTALEEAALRGHFRIVVLFLRSGVQIPPEKSRRAAELARKEGYRLILHLLESWAKGIQI